MTLRLTVLGSGTIIPEPWRQATSLLVEAGETRVLLDCAPGALEALERGGRSFRSVRRVLLTHFHPDHTLGLGRLFAALANDRAAAAPQELVIHGPTGLAGFIAGWNALYDGIVPAAEALSLVEMAAGDAAVIGDIAVLAGPADHGRCPALSYRLSAGSRSLVFTGDTAYSRGLAVFARGADLLVAECSFPDGYAAEGHMTPEQAGRLAREAGAGAVLLVHMYPCFGKTDPAAGVRRSYTGSVTTGRDGMAIEL